MSDRSNPEKRSALRVRPGVNEPGGARGHGRAKRTSLSTREYVEGVRSGDRTLLARAITLIESNARDHFAQARELVRELLPHTGGSVRVGITGVPGAGKSTLIEALGRRLVERGDKVAVTAVDPTSSLTGGSIMGDKTRMETLAGHERAFVRPSPSGGALGGVARKTRETILLFEAAGYDVVLVETIGVGQSEIAVRSLVDFFLLMLTPGSGDELQGLKRGVVELADAILINKADDGNEGAAERARRDYESALRYLAASSGGWTPHAYTASALTGKGVGEIWSVVERFVATTKKSGSFAQRRRSQARDWIHDLVRETLAREFNRHPEVQRLLPELERQVVEGKLPATSAAIRLLEAFGLEPLKQ
ncbi:MAG: putative GTPase [Calditrichaeota bacterium]|nr:putative GTPase [Calditrichota bacterium]